MSAHPQANSSRWVGRARGLFGGSVAVTNALCMGRASHLYFLNTSAALWPPNPKLSLMIAVGMSSWA